MSEENLKKCHECGLPFYEYDDVVVFEDSGESYHPDCIEIFARGYYAMDKNGNPLGELESENGMAAYEAFNWDETKYKKGFNPED